MKRILQLSTVSVMLLSLLAMSDTVLASEVTGNLSTGISGVVGNTLTGTVIVPPVTNPPAAGYYSGGGGGSSGFANTAIKGDTNGDRKVNITDFVTLMANWGKTGSGNVADFNVDSKVNISDFVILMANWTK